MDRAAKKEFLNNEKREGTFGMQEAQAGTVTC